MAMDQNNGQFGHPNNVFCFEHRNDVQRRFSALSIATTTILMNQHNAGYGSRPPIMQGTSHECLVLEQDWAILLQPEVATEPIDLFDDRFNEFN